MKKLLELLKCREKIELLKIKSDKKSNNKIKVMAESWNLTSIEPLDDSNYFLWSEKIEGILRSKKLWKKVINVKPPEKPEEEDEDYRNKYKV